jgi:cyclopropane-fatty-acyl-phospholipid synthase
LPRRLSAGPEFHVRSPSAIAHFVRSPGELGLGRAYVAGLVIVDDLDAAFVVVDDWEPPPIPPRTRARLTLAALAAAGLTGIPRRPSLELRLAGRRHTIERDRAAVRYHYNVGNEFFALFLDASMT